MGVIKCDCGSKRPDERARCTANRYFFIHLQTVIAAPDKAARHTIVNGLERSHGYPYAEELRAEVRAHFEASKLQPPASAGQPRADESRRQLTPGGLFSRDTYRESGGVTP